MWRSGPALLLAASALSWERGALAQPAPLRRVKVTAPIEYEVEGPLHCPSKARFLAELASRWGYDPSEPGVTGVAIGRFKVVVRREVVPREGPRNVARVRFWDAQGVEQAEEVFKAPSPSARGCDYLVEKDVVASIVGALVVLEPAQGPPPAPAPPPIPAPPAPPSPQELPPPDPAPPPPPPRTQVALRFGAGATGGLVTVPRTVAWGMMGELGIQAGAVSVSGQARYMPPAGVTLTAGEQVNVKLVTGGLVACWHVKWLAACGVGEVGSVQVSGPPLHSNALARGTVGPRLNLEVPLVVPGLALQITAEYLKALELRQVLYVREPFELPAVDAGGGLGFVYTLPVRKRPSQGEGTQQ